MASVINALLDDDDDGEHNISRVYSSTAARLDRLGESARCCDSASLQPVRQHNLDCVRKPLDRSHRNSCNVCAPQPLRQHNLDCVEQLLPGSLNGAGPISPHWMYSRLVLDVLYLVLARSTTAASPSGSSSPRPPCCHTRRVYVATRKFLTGLLSTRTLIGLRSLTMNSDHKIIWKLFRLT